jgi:hypothetical protein
MTNLPQRDPDRQALYEAAVEAERFLTSLRERGSIGDSPIIRKLYRAIVAEESRLCKAPAVPHGGNTHK